MEEGRDADKHVVPQASWLWALFCPADRTESGAGVCWCPL